jgi:integration host factor subunit alpha
VFSLARPVNLDNQPEYVQVFGTLSVNPLSLRRLIMTLTKADIVNYIHSQLGITKTESADAVEILLELIKKSLESGDDVLISGFGKFCVKEKNERKGRNPATGETMMMRPRKVVTFKSSGGLRRKINGGS